MNKPLTFTAKESNSTIYLAAAGLLVIDSLQYRLNKNDNWISYKIGTKIELKNIGDYIQFQNTKNQLSTSYIEYVQFKMTGKIAASGNIQSLLNYSTYCTPYCYYFMFYDCKSLTKAPELPATNLADSCYFGMFDSCTNLIEAPELPATELAKYCYSNMFNNCTSLTEAIELPATNLTIGCYADMFESCTSLIKTPELPATNLTKNCYSFMFAGCTNLIEVPELSAVNLAKNCYRFMFSGCKSLKNKPKISSLIEQIVYNY